MAPIIDALIVITARVGVGRFRYRTISVHTLSVHVHPFVPKLSCTESDLTSRVHGRRWPAHGLYTAEAEAQAETDANVAKAEAKARGQGQLL